MALTFNVPDLSGLKTLSPTLFLTNFSQGLQDYFTRVFLLNYVRLVDLAIEEYQIARGKLIQERGPMDTFKVTRWVEQCNHFEVCITSINRSINHLKAIKNNKNLPKLFINLIPRKLKILSGNIESQITAFRDTIHHLEERLLRGEIKEGQFIGIRPKEDYIELETCKMYYKDLAECLKELHSTAEKLSVYKVIFPKKLYHILS